VDGLDAASIQRPTAASEVAEMLRTASDLRRSVVPFGGRLSLATGNIVPPVDLGLDLSALTGIHSYLPADLTLSVASGTTFTEIRDALGERGQELPIDVPFPDHATIGGLIATGFAGPRRFGYGSLKDLLIGCEFVRGDGLLGHAGGMVVKNVSGFEIPRFLHGSWGSLAVLTSVNLKVMPRPRSEATLLIQADSMASGLKQAQGILFSHPSLAACTVTRLGGEISVAARIMGREKAVEATSQTLLNDGTISGRNTVVLDPASSRAFWQTYCEDWAGTSNDVHVSIGTRPRDVAALVSAVEDRFESIHAPVDLCASPGTGSVRFRFDQASVRGEQFWDQLDPATLPAQSTAYVESAPAAWKEGVNVWRNEGAGESLMQAIKQQFDPQGILNPGRLFI